MLIFIGKYERALNIIRDIQYFELRICSFG